MHYICQSEDCEGFNLPNPEFGSDRYDNKHCVYCGGPIVERVDTLNDFTPQPHLSAREQAAYRLGILDFLLWSIEEESISSPAPEILQALEAERILRHRQLDPHAPSNLLTLTDDDLAEADHVLEFNAMMKELERRGE